MYVLCTRNAQESCFGIALVELLSYGDPPESIPLPQSLVEKTNCFLQEPRARIIGAYCEYLSAPEQHTAILDRLLVSNWRRRLCEGAPAFHESGPEAAGRHHKNH